MQNKRDDEDNNTLSTTNSVRDKKPESAGKRRVYVVPSRYMQKPEHSVLQKKSTPVLSTTIISRGSGAKPKVGKTPVLKPKFQGGLNKIHSSTPTSDSSRVQSFEDGNVSTISLISKMTIVPAMKTALGPAFNDEGTVPNLKKFTGSPSKTKPRAVRPPQVASTEPNVAVPTRSREDASDAQNFDLLYAKEELLACRLQEKQDTQDKNIKQNLSLLSALSLKNNELAEEETYLVNELQRKRHQLQVHELLTEHNKKLQETLSDMPEVLEYLNAIKNSLDQCQSEIPLRNIKLPESEDNLVLSLESLNSLLTEKLHSNTSLSMQLSNISSAIPDIRGTLESTSALISRSENLASKLNQMSNKENSVLIQRIQEINCPSMSFEDPKWIESFKFV